MDSSLFTPHSNPETHHSGPSQTAQTESAGLNFAFPNSDTNSLIQTGIHVEPNQPDSSVSNSSSTHSGLEAGLFANSCTPVPASIPNEPDHAYHILIKLGLSTSHHNNVHKNVPHLKPCQKMTERLYENPCQPMDQSQLGRNSDPMSLNQYNDLFSNSDASTSVSHESSSSTPTTPVVPRALRKVLVEEKEESQPNSTTLHIEDSPHQTTTITPGFTTIHRETPMSTTHTPMDSTPHHTPHHDEEYIDPLNQDNLRRSSMTTDKTVDSRRVSSASEALKDQEAEKLAYIGNENLINIKSDMKARPDPSSKERYRQTSLQITRENKAVQKCSCNIF